MPWDAGKGGRRDCQPSFFTEAGESGAWHLPAIISSHNSTHTLKVPHRVFASFSFFSISEAAAERPPERDFGSKGNSCTTRATTQRIIITAHQHNQQPTAGNQQQPQQQTTTNAQSQEQQQQRNHATPSKNRNNCSIELRPRKHPLPHRCPRLHTKKKGCRQQRQQLQQKLMSHGIKQHGDSFAASSDSGSAIKASGPEPQKHTCVTQKKTAVVHK